MSLTQFSRNTSRNFIHISNDNRLHLWDSDTRKEKHSFVEKHHLSHSYTCSSWQFQASKKTDKEDKIADGYGYFAVGCNDGTVVIWDLSRGVVIKSIGISGESEVPTCITFATDGNSIYVGSNGEKIIQYTVKTGEQISSFKSGKKGCLKMSINPIANVLACGSTSIRLIELDTGRKRKLDAPFSGGVNGLEFSQCGRYLACCGSGSREVLCFDVSNTESSEPIYAIAVDGLPKSIAAKSNGNSVDVLAAFEDIGGCLIRYSVNKKEEATTSTTKIISKDNIIASTFNKAGVTFASGLTTLPYFSVFSINDENGDLLSEIKLKEHSVKSSINIKEKTNEIINSNHVAILGPNDMGGVKRPIVNENNDGDVAILKKSRGDSIEEEELTLEQRLDILNDSISVMEKNVNVSTKINEISQAPTSDSLVTLIEQALQSGDDTLLEQCLGCEDINVVEATAKRLPISRIVVFIKKLVSKFEKRPSRGLLLTRWLAAILRFHTSYLIAVPDLSHQLAGLSQILEQRLSSYTKLASLSGRLDLLMSQVTAPSVTEKSGAKPSKPLKVYKEK